MTSASSIGLIENPLWQQNLTAVRFSATAFGDIDNDGDLDLALIGCLDDGANDCENGVVAKIYANNGTNLIENQIWQQNLTGAGYGSLSFGDIDNDGDLDLALSGCTNGTNWYCADDNKKSKIYTNNGTSFIENQIWQQNLTPAHDSSITFGDVDDDGDLDLVLNGVGAFVPDYISKIYINNGTSLIENQTWQQNLTGVYEGELTLGDVDNDGDLDLVLTGQSAGDHLNIYKNNGSSLLENQTRYTIGNGVIGIYRASIALGDYDNDGDLDLAAIGNEQGYSRVYENNESNNNYFQEDTVAHANISDDLFQGCIVWGDVDNDTLLDLIVTGSAGGLIAKVYINNGTISNSQPLSPSSSFSYSYKDRRINLGWENGSDNETNSSGLYYNLKLGTVLNGHSIIGGIYGGSGGGGGGGGGANGYFGNMMQRKNFTLKVDRLEPSTTYYWYVQSIDTGLKAGNWSVMQSFTTPADMERPGVVLNSPALYYNSSSYIVDFNASVTENMNLSNVSLWGNWSSWHVNQTNSSGTNDSDYVFSVNLTGYEDGYYKWLIEAKDNSTNIQNSSERVFTLDTTSPNVTGETEDLSVVYTNTSVTFNATITDILVGVESVWVSVNTSGDYENFSVSSGNSVYSFILDSWNYSKGNNVSWRYYANDSVGNIQTGNLQSFVIANSAPNIGGIPDNSTNEDTTPPDMFYNLSSYASDVDNDNLTFYVQSQSNSSLINCSVYNSSFYYLNCSAPAANLSGSSSIIINVTDGSDWKNYTFVISINALNDVPWLTSMNLTAGTNATNETLYGSYAFNDVESSEAANEIKWYKDGIEVGNLVNVSYVSSGNTSKGENWTFSTRSYDGSDWSEWENSSVLMILNTAPSFSSIENQSWLINSNLSLSLEDYFTDIDADNLSFMNTSTENITIIINQTTGIVTLIPVLGWNGSSSVVFTANDSEEVREGNNITLNVFRPQINFTEFDGFTTNFSELDYFVNISIVIEKASHGKINFSSVTLNQSVLDVNSFVNISFNRIEVNSSTLPSLNKQATLYLYNLSFSNPRVLKDGSVCSVAECPELGYSSGVFSFNVSSFSVYSAEETPTGGEITGGGGGGGGTPTIKTYVITDSQLSQGYSKILAESERLKFSVENESHYVTLVEVDSSSARINVSSKLQEATLLPGQEEKFELTNDNYYDILVRLNSVEDNKANVSIKSIREEITEEKVGKEVGEETGEVEREEIDEEKGIPEANLNKGKENILGIILIASCFVVVIVVILIMFLKKHVKHKKWKKWSLFGK